MSRSERDEYEARQDYDPGLDLIKANQEVIIGVFREATRRIRRIVEDSATPNSAVSRHILLIISRAFEFHPMHCESWTGWPGEEDS